MTALGGWWLTPDAPPPAAIKSNQGQESSARAVVTAAAGHLKPAESMGRSTAELLARATELWANTVNTLARPANPVDTKHAAGPYAAAPSLVGVRWLDEPAARATEAWRLRVDEASAAPPAAPAAAKVFGNWQLIFMRIYVYICIYVCICVHMYMYMYIYICICVYV
jgi:hypothetical protein